ncbi:MAG: putative toxin-antitoxin system toxin component, PIN family [Nostoc sp.]|uniref:putative toxin-antitoxin system toxin component, PIN family n=1 Tax=Nostoc sp. TaxID=1180 RepID=UPI002FFCD0DB
MGIGHGAWGIALSAPLFTPHLRDPDDTVILETAITANAEVIVTGDLDLLVLTEFNAIPI